MDEIFTPQIQESGNTVFRLGTVGAKYTTGTKGITVKFDGESSASGKRFKCNSSVSFAVNDRVLCCLVGGTWVVLCKVGDPT